MMPKTAIFFYQIHTGMFLMLEFIIIDFMSVFVFTT